MQANHLPVARSDTTALTVSEEIRQRFDEFSRSQKDVGQYIVDHLEEAAFHGRGAGPAREHLVVDRGPLRAGARLRGLPRASGRRPRRVQARARGERRRRALGTAAFPIDQTEFEAALAADHANVEETARRVDRDEVAAAAELISGAERIVLCGTDQMAFFASYLRHLLMLLDLRAEVVASPSQEGLATRARGREDGARGLLGRPAAPSWSVPSSWPATAARRRSRSPTRPSPRSPSWRTTSSTTRRTVRPTCARTPRCWE